MAYFIFRSRVRDFFDYMTTEKENLRKNRRPKTISNYETALRSFRHFWGIDHCPLKR